MSGVQRGEVKESVRDPEVVTLSKRTCRIRITSAWHTRSTISGAANM